MASVPRAMGKGPVRWLKKSLEGYLSLNYRFQPKADLKKQVTLVYYFCFESYAAIFCV
mgnify:CR=1 FL=1